MKSYIKPLLRLLWPEWLVVAADALHALEELGAVNQTSLVVDTGVDEVRVVDRGLESTVHDVVGGLDTLHEAVVLVTDLVPPGAEAATGPDVHVLELRQELLEDTLTLERWGWVSVVEAAVVSADDLVGRLEHLGVDETLNAVLQHVLLVDRLHARLRNLKHDAPVWALSDSVRLWLAAISELDGRELDGSDRLVVWGVVGEDGGAVEWAVVLGEVEPALVADAFRAVATDTDTNDMSAAVEKTLREADQVLVAHGLSEEVDAHGADELVVLDGGSVLEGNFVGVGVNLGDGTVLAEAALVFGKSVGDGNPDTTGTTNGWETESRVWSPVARGLLEDDVLGDRLEVWSCNALTEPLALHLDVTVSMTPRLSLTVRNFLPLLLAQPRPCSCMAS